MPSRLDPYLDVIAMAAVILVVTLALTWLPRDGSAVEPRLLREQLVAEKTDLDRMQREVAAYDALNRVTADQIRYLQLEAKQP